MTIDIEQLDWQKVNNLMPVVIQESKTQQVLMLGYMDREALEKTLSTGFVVFYSRSKQRLWMKGETSGNVLQVESIYADCDQDSLLVQAKAFHKPTCHLGRASCFDYKNDENIAVLTTLEDTIQSRMQSNQPESYVKNLILAGKNRIAQKVGEEAVEVVIASMNNNNEELINEAADLLFHLLVLLAHSGLSLAAVLQELNNRANKKETK